jgi:hypothetical protein
MDNRNNNNNQRPIPCSRILREAALFIALFAALSVSYGIISGIRIFSSSFMLVCVDFVQKVACVTRWECWLKAHELGFMAIVASLAIACRLLFLYWTRPRAQVDYVHWGDRAPWAGVHGPLLDEIRARRLD